jgi:hypothetical protein
MKFKGIKDNVKTMIVGEHIDVNIKKYLNTMTDFNSKADVYTYLIHLGYLAYDRIENNAIFLTMKYALNGFMLSKMIKVMPKRFAL